jgi:hypothetical protein
MRVMFMRPALYFPSRMLTSDVIKLLAYMTQRLLEDVRVQYEGFTFVADLQVWKMQNFSQSYALNWFFAMMVMTVRLESFVIIDAPGWFGSIWSIIKVAMTRSFREKWTYVTRETVDTVMPRESCPSDIADGSLDINLEEWCHARRLAEQGETETPFRRFKSSAMALSSSSSAPELRSSHTDTSLGDSGMIEVGEDSSLGGLDDEIDARGIDAAKFQGKLLRTSAFESDEGRSDHVAQNDVAMAVLEEARKSLREVLAHTDDSNLGKGELVAALKRMDDAVAKMKAREEYLL